jgi:hypothetical protein
VGRRMVGPGKPLDTDRYFVICANVLGGCMGTTGPMPRSSRRPAALGPVDLPGHHHPRHGARAGETGRPARHRPRCSAWSAARWAACRCCNGPRPIPTASSRRCRSPCAARHSAQNIAFHEVGRQAVMADPDWRGGDYLAEGISPRIGPRRGAHGRAHHLSLGAALHRKFGRNLQDRERRLSSASTPTSRWRAICATRASTFVERFDANSYLYITRAMDYFDLAAEHGGRSRTPSKARGPASASSPSPATGCSRPREQGASCARSTRRRPTSASSRSRPTAATTPSCSTSRIAELVPPGTRVLDVGCGDGALLTLLEATRGVDGRGIEISRSEGVNECVARGLSVIQGDADTDLVDYPDDAFDYVILSQTLQATRIPARSSSRCCASAGKRSSPSPISGTGGSAA